ncbi:MAG: Ribosomal protein L22 [Candidatus Alkanophagales archaeon MCA70_species_2]|nr:Ribosomal protein L22 [Candidatus Alkanophaga liquidiphilum]RLG38519.1 MAG: 50S ribosomal protein L22 [Candidatus Alkanophagales archaeon]
MGRLRFCVEADDETSAKAMACELHISRKHAYEICNVIRGMKFGNAKKYLQEVIEMKRAVPFKKHKRKVGHRRGLNKWYAGRYPVKAAEAILRLLEDAAANASYKGLDPEEMRIWHIATKKGRTIRGIMPRAFGRATPKNTETVTVEVILKGGEGEH